MTEKFSSKYDPQNMYQAIYDFPDHIADAIRIGAAIVLNQDYTDVHSIVVAGMGGSAIGGDVANMLVGEQLSVPVKVVRGYKLPNWANVKTLVICSSYSGNTEETLAIYAEARTRGIRICGITTGGTIGDLLDRDGLDKVMIVPGLQPRAALAYSFVTLLYLLKNLDVIDGEFEIWLQQTVELLKVGRDKYSAASNNPARHLAGEIAGKLPIIYGETESTAVVARRWCGQLSENGKMLAYYNELPEMNHNEIVGWENNPEILKKMVILWLKDSDDHPRVQIRQQISERLIANYCDQEIITVDGPNRFVRLLHLIHFGDWLSYWCALEHRTDPTPVTKINALKNKLAEL
ncbi:MAG: bifunctional phosphoglucose/phosphomannose isomerase [Candidatus Neomarinimicrobiota bacterium]